MLVQLIMSDRISLTLLTTTSGRIEVVLRQSRELSLLVIIVVVVTDPKHS